MASSLYSRLRERGVVRVATSYAVIGWLLLQIADVALEPWELPGWVRRAPLVIVVLGFPVAVVLAWFFEFGENGVERDTAPDETSRPTARGLRRYADVVVISLLSAVVAYFLMRDAGWLGEAAGPRVTVEHTSLAVLPLVSVGAVSDDYLAEGFSDELRDQFARLRSLSVTSRSSSMAFAGQSLDAVTIASKLAVATLLEGTIGRERGRIEVSVQLVDGQTGKVVWSERYDRSDKDVLDVQSEIADAVVAAVLPRFSATGNRTPPPPTQDPVAYDFYLLGKQHLRKADDAGARDDRAAAMAWADKAVTAFRSAIAADPGFAQAHAVLAYALMPQEDQSDKRALAEFCDREVLPEVERALQLDPANAYAYFVKGLVLRTTQRPGGSVFYRRAYELDPGNDQVLAALAASATTAGYFDERFRFVMLARDRDPMTLQHHIQAMVSAAFLGRFDQMRAIVERMLQLFPDDVTANNIACRSLWFSGAQDDALACAARNLAQRPGDVQTVQWANTLAGDAWEAMGDTTEALRYFDRSAAAGGSDGADQAIRLQRDQAAMRRRARELVGHEVAIDDWPTADLLFRVGLPDEALALYRRCGMADLATLDSNQLPGAMFGYAQMILLLRRHGEFEQAAKLLPALLNYTSVAIEHGARRAGLRLLRAQALMLAGLNDEALEQISQAIDGPGAPFPDSWLSGDPVLREMAKEPRFRALVVQLRQRQEETRARLPTTFHRLGLAWPMPT